jgi:hypothetical protein
MNTAERSAEIPAQGNPQAAPNVPALINAFQTCSPWSRNGWNRVRTNEDVRFLRWPSQNAECKKTGTRDKPPFPWEGASDQKCPVADDIVNSIVDHLVTAFWRAWMTPKAGSHAVSNYAVKLLDYVVNTWRTDHLEEQVELAANYLYTYGWVALHPCWDFELSLEQRTITLAQLAGVAETLSRRLEGQSDSVPEALLGLVHLPVLIADASREALAMEALDLAWQAYGLQQLGRSDISLPPLSTATLRRAVRDLRAHEQADVPVPYVCKDHPSLYALKPWEEFLLPGNATDVDRVPCFQVDWLSEVELRAKQRTEGWDPGWIGEALKHKGKLSAWSLGTTVNRQPDASISAAMSGTGLESIYEPATTPHELIEIVYAVYRMVDDDGVPGVYLTVLHPAIGRAGDSSVSKASNHAWHGLLKDARGRVPYVVGKREHVARTITSSRGVPEICQSWQRMTKIQVDGAMDWTSIGVLPPINEYATAIKTNYKYGPAVRNTVQQGKEPTFMQIPGQGVPVAFEMLDRIEMWVDRYFGRRNTKLPNEEADVRMQKKVNSFLLLMTRALLRSIDQCQARMPDAKFAEITGAPPGWLESNRGQPGLLSARLECDIRELNPEYVAAMLKTVNEAVIPQDVNGMTNRAAWTRAQWQMINPRLARSVVVDAGDASEQMFEKVKSDVALMFVGQEAKYVENDPSAKAKVGYVQQILQANPNYTAALQNNARFRELLEKYVTNLQFSITQDQNKMVGRVGVQPDSMENA